MDESAYHKFMQLSYLVAKVQDKELAKQLRIGIEDLKHEFNRQSKSSFSTTSIYGQKYDTEWIGSTTTGYHRRLFSLSK